jgi:hypothetical protein
MGLPRLISRENEVRANLKNVNKTAQVKKNISREER